MAYDMFRCPKCKSVIYDYDWTMTSDDEEGFDCTQCGITYVGDELNKLMDEFAHEVRPNDECSTFADLDTD